MPKPRSYNVETLWEDYKGPPAAKWMEQMKPEKIYYRFGVPMFVGTFPNRPFTVVGFVWVLERPQTQKPQDAALQELANLARAHGADAFSLLRPPPWTWRRWYAAGTAIKFR